MPPITKDNRWFTLINVFTVEPKNQARLIDLLITATSEVMENLPGFISAAIHRGDDGRRVVNYAQWRSQDDFHSMLKNPAAQKHMQAVTAIAQADPHSYEVVEVIESAVSVHSGVPSH